MDARRSFDAGRNDSYNSMLLDARGQAMSELLTARNQPINEITALMGGGQVQQPQFATLRKPEWPESTSRASLRTTSPIAQQPSGDAWWPFGSGRGCAGCWALSDRRLKKDVKNIGRLNDGHGTLSFRYRDGVGRRNTKVGVMAQEIEDRHPYAVAKTNRGIKAVDYSALAEPCGTVHRNAQPRHWTQAAARLRMRLSPAFGEANSLPTLIARTVISALFSSRRFCVCPATDPASIPWRPRLLPPQARSPSPRRSTPNINDLGTEITGSLPRNGSAA